LVLALGEINREDYRQTGDIHDRCFSCGGMGVTGPLFGFSDTWQLVINTGTTIITFS
jgi:low affinity Fe/Cu permease